MEKITVRLLRLAAQLGLVLVAYTLCRVAFVVANRHELALDSAETVFWVFVSGLRFDLSAITIINGLFILLSILPFPFIANKWYQIILKWIYIVTNFVGISFNLADVVYFEFIHRRSQADIISFLDGSRGNDFYRLLPTFLIMHWYIFLGIFAIIFLLYFFYQKTIKTVHKQSISVRLVLASMGGMVVVAGLGILAIRGGVQRRPIGMINASDGVSALNVPAVLNTPFSIVATWGKPGLSDAKLVDDRYITALNKGIHFPENDKTFQKKNVVIIIVESLSKKYVGCLGGKAETPFIDSLFGKSYLFYNAFANAKQSIQGLPAILSSLPSWQDEPFMYSPYASTRITSLPDLLKKYGYQTSFFHGGFNGTMNFDAYCSMAGVDAYYGYNQYPNAQADYDGNWGIWDEPFLQFMADKLEATPQPFCATVFTLNTHHPYSLPPQHSAFARPDYPMLGCVRYLDLALSRFFARASRQPWFANTLFVITADHASPIMDDGEGTMDHFKIPIAFYEPGNPAMQGKSSLIANQIDISPSLLSLLHYPDPYYAIGQNLFDQKADHIAITFNGGVYQYIDSNYCYQFNGQTPVGYYHWATDPGLSNNLLSTPLTAEQQARDIRLKTMIQFYNQSMIHNQMHTSEIRP